MVETDLPARLVWTHDKEAAAPQSSSLTVQGTENAESYTFQWDTRRCTLMVNPGSADLTFTLYGGKNPTRSTDLLNNDSAVKCVSVGLNAGNGWSHSWTVSGSLSDNPPSDSSFPETNKSGIPYLFYVVEKPVMGYAISYGPDGVAEGTLTVTNAAEGSQPEDPPEPAGYVLPKTGGPGTAGFTVLGALLSLTAGAALTLTRRKEETD